MRGLGVSALNADGLSCMFTFEHCEGEASDRCFYVIWQMTHERRKQC